MDTEGGFDVHLSIPFAAIISGPSSSGKSFFVKKLLENSSQVLSQIPENIIYCYSCWQKLYDELACKFPNLKFVEGIPASLCDDSLLPPNKVNLIIIDDLMEAASENDEIQKAFTKYTHHRNLCILYLVQNLFFQGKMSRTINLNANYMILFKNPRDKLQINTLARQMYPRNSNFFLEAFEDATKQPYCYLLVDLKAQTPEDYRLRTGLFQPDWPATYIMKKPKAKRL